MYTDDGMLQFYFDSINECVAFCKEQGIKPNRDELEEKRKKAQSEVDRLGQLIKALGENNGTI